MFEKFKDLWILRAHYKRQTEERFFLWFVWKLPRSLIMWASIRLIAHATTGQYGNTVVPELTAMDALERWK